MTRSSQSSDKPPENRGTDLERMLTASRNKLKAVFDSIDDPIVSVTLQNTVESVNMALANLTGLHPRQLVGRPVEEVITLLNLSSQGVELTQQTMAEAMDQGSPQSRLLDEGSREEPHYWMISVTPAKDSEEKLALAIIQFRDVTTFKVMEETIRRHSETLEAQVAERTRELVEARDQLGRDKERLVKVNAELKRLDQLRHDLTNMVVHDLKGPLAEIMGNLDLIAYEPLSENQQEYLDMATLGCEDLLRMIMNLLDIDRLEEGRLRLKLERIRFGNLAAMVRDKFKTVLYLKKLQVEINDQCDQPMLVDEGLMTRVLQNLLTNAINHTPGGGHITLEARQDEPDRITFQVADTGSGIPQRYQDRIFMKFTQASDGEGPRTSTGLGLAFCQMAVSAHGGRLWFESEEGQGTTFYVSLPLNPED